MNRNIYVLLFFSITLFSCSQEEEKYPLDLCEHSIRLENIKEGELICSLIADSIDHRIGELKELKELILQGDNVPYIPTSWYFPELIYFESFENQFVEMPDVINRWQSLKELVISFKQMQFSKNGGTLTDILLDSLRDLRYLTIFYAKVDSNTQLSLHPQARIRRLSFKDVWYINEMRPPRKANLEKTTHLSIVDCRVRRLPAWVYDMPNLESLVLSGNSLHPLSPKVANWKKLKTLRIEANEWTMPLYLPEELGMLRELEVIYADGSNVHFSEKLIENIARFNPGLKLVVEQDSLINRYKSVINIQNAWGE